MDYEQNLDALLAELDNQDYLILLHSFATELLGELESAQKLFTRRGQIWPSECKRVIDSLRQIDYPLFRNGSIKTPFEEILLKGIVDGIHQKINQLTRDIEDFRRNCEGSSQKLYIKLEKVLRSLDNVLPQVSTLANKLKYKLQSIKVETNLPPEEHTYSSYKETISNATKDVPLDARVKTLYTYLPSGILNLYDKKTMPLLEYTCINNTSDTVKFILRSFIEGFSSDWPDTVPVKPRSQEPFHQLPPLKVEEAKKLTEIRRAVLHTTVAYLKDGIEYQLGPQAFDIYLLARNMIRWTVPDVAKGSGFKPLLEHIAAWVTPRVEEVKKMVREAANYHPDERLVGYPDPPNKAVVSLQVRAIYLALREKAKISYIASTFAIGSMDYKRYQAVRLPRESLSDQSANCLDGAVLYASLIEAADLEPVIVIQKKHAFVGWKTRRSSEKHEDEYEFLETTVTRKASFEVACKAGMEKYEKLLKDGSFERDVFDPKGFARLLDIKRLHDTGIYPME
jgi:hypothetical protein